jgi:hypothetical protein
MDIRKSINALLVSLLLIWRVFGGRSAAEANQGKAFFSDDDGKSWFVDDDSKLPPFEHNGKTAYGAAVYRCLTGKPFVAYLEKYSDSQLAKIAAEKQEYAQQHPDSAPMTGVPYYPMDVKKPGEPQWFPATADGGHYNAAAYQRVTKLVCPDGSSQVTMVRPSDNDAGQ